MRVSLQPVMTDKTQRDPQKPVRDVRASSDLLWQSETPSPHRITQTKTVLKDSTALEPGLSSNLLGLVVAKSALWPRLKSKPLLAMHCKWFMLPMMPDEGTR